uniref:Uncharacterized protein n=1 Tax=Oncorhynchus mykiss TaxID=8022 RepID=A0A8K9WPG4_ONCMY
GFSCNGTAKGISCHFWDVGGQEKLRPLWKSYSRGTDGIIYVVDSVDVDRLEEAKTELHKVTKFAENQGTPLLVIANKQDLPKSLPNGGVLERPTCWCWMCFKPILFFQSTNKQTAKHAQTLGSL